MSIPGGAVGANSGTDGGRGGVEDRLLQQGPPRPPSQEEGEDCAGCYDVINMTGLLVYRWIFGWTHVLLLPCKQRRKATVKFWAQNVHK